MLRMVPPFTQFSIMEDVAPGNRKEQAPCSLGIYFSTIAWSVANWLSINASVKYSYIILILLQLNGISVDLDVKILKINLNQNFKSLICLLIFFLLQSQVIYSVLNFCVFMCCSSRTDSRGLRGRINFLESQPRRTKDLENGNRYKPERWLSSGQMLCERLPCPNGELNALGPPTQDPH